MDTAVKSPAFPFRRVFSPFKRRRPISFDAVPLLAGRQARLLRRHMRAPSSQPPFAPRRRRPRPQRRPANRRRRLFVPPPVRPRVSARRAAYRDSAAAALPPLRTRMSIREAYVRQLLELSKIGPFQSTTDDRAKLKVGVRLNLHGIVLIESTTKVKTDFPGWSNWEGFERCQCNWNWGQFPRPAFCSYSASNRVLKHCKMLGSVIM
ncbi:hypothetical protein ACS0TY_019460 [Phlomoides rotata]